MRKKTSIAGETAILGLIALLTPWHTAEAQDAAIPDLSGLWIAGGFDPPLTGRGGVRMHPEYIQRGTRDENRNRQNPIPPIADLSDPILKPWAVERLRPIVERRIAGEIIPEARSQCLPMGTPMLISEGGPRLILQTADRVTIVNEELPEVRHIYLNAAHPENIVPSWYGEAVGHYEDGALAVTTIGISAKTWVDDFLTPHTEAMRVSERYTLLEDGDSIEVSFTVEDPETFNEPWSGIVFYERAPEGREFQEIRCSEYNYDVFTGQTLPMPTATKLDF